MNGSATSLHHPGHRPGLTPVAMDSLISELDFHRREARRLALMNELHARLARAVDLPGMVEAFSVWLQPHVGHELIAYINPKRQRRYQFCSCHGPLRRKVTRIAQEAMGQGEGGLTGEPQEEFLLYRWRLDSHPRERDAVLLLCAAPLDRAAQRLVQDGLQVLREPLLRALDYEDLFELANQDALTGLANRRVFEERLGPMLESARRHGHPLSVAALDLDYFKEVNDTLGHAEGDRVLRRVAQVLKETVRASDLLVRMGGDEFLLLLPETRLEDAGNLAQRLVAGINDLGVEAAGRRLGISIGLVQWQEGMSRDELLQRADEALYRAKAQGRNRVVAPAAPAPSMIM